MIGVGYYYVAYSCSATLTNSVYKLMSELGNCYLARLSALSTGTGLHALVCTVRLFCNTTLIPLMRRGNYRFLGGSAVKTVLYHFSVNRTGSGYVLGFAPVVRSGNYIVTLRRALGTDVGHNTVFGTALCLSYATLTPSVCLRLDIIGYIAVSAIVADILGVSHFGTGRLNYRLCVTFMLTCCLVTAIIAYSVTTEVVSRR